jgi:hypothetical protein
MPERSPHKALIPDPRGKIRRQLPPEKAVWRLPPNAAICCAEGCSHPLYPTQANVTLPCVSTRSRSGRLLAEMLRRSWYRYDPDSIEVPGGVTG